MYVETGRQLASRSRLKNFFVTLAWIQEPSQILDTRAGSFQQLANGSLLYLYSEPVCHLPQFAPIHLIHIHSRSRLDFLDLMSLPVSRMLIRKRNIKNIHNYFIFIAQYRFDSPGRLFLSSLLVFLFLSFLKEKHYKSQYA